MFAPFIEDDESFASYVSRMNKDGCWTGDLELVASNMLLANRGPLVRYTSLGDER
jgi:OTU domain-containing protein 3